MELSGQGAVARRPERDSRLAKAALASGIIQFVLPPAAVVAIVLGHFAVREIRLAGQGDLWIARTGYILGYLGLLLGMVVPLLLWS